MRKEILLYLLALLNSGDILSQRVLSDSPEIRNIHSKRDSFVLDPEIKKAINEGVFFINGEGKKTNSSQQSSSIKMPIQMDFSEYLKIKKDDEDEFLSKIKRDIENLPPQVFWLYFPELDNPKRKVSDKLLDFMDGIKQTKSSGGPGTILSGDFNDVLSSAFDPHYRQLKKNRKTAIAYKTYNDIPSAEFLKKQREFFEKHPEIVLPERRKDANVEKTDSINVTEEKIPVQMMESEQTSD